MSCNKKYKGAKRVSDEKTMEARRARYKANVSLVSAARAIGVGEPTLCHYENLSGEYPTNMTPEQFESLMEFYRKAAKTGHALRERCRYSNDDRITDEQTAEMIEARKRGGIPRRVAAQFLGDVKSNTIYNWEVAGRANAPVPAYESLMEFYKDMRNWSDRAVARYEAEIRETVIEKADDERTQREQKHAKNKELIKSLEEKKVAKKARMRGEEIPEVLRSMRKFAGMTLREAGELTGVNGSLIARYEYGAAAPSAEIFEQLFAIYLMRSMRNRNEAQKMFDSYFA